ncbi:MAG TPA: hypothetical protein VKD21_13590 [Acidimicrobiales bacterium]|nr:hypothetical protein [Acidimicrobiales bacterium]
MSDLGERLDRLADAAAEGVEVTRPDQRQAGRPWWRTEPALVAVGALVVVGIVTAAILVGGDNGDNDVAVGGDDGGGSAGQGTDAVVAVTYGDVSLGGGPPDLELRFLDADGAVIAERSSSELDREADIAEAGGIVQRVPAGDLELEATLQQGGDVESCTQPFAAAPGDRLILRVQLGLEAAAGADCAQVQSVDDWVADRSGPTGESYIGLTQAEADEQARQAGLTTRVVGVDGMDLAATMDFRPDRLNLLLFDGTVVAGQLDGEEAAAGGTEPGGTEPGGTEPGGAVPAGHGTLTVELERVDGVPPVQGVTVGLEAYDSGGEVVAEPDWGQSAEGVLLTTVPAGRMRLVSVTSSPSVPGGLRCETPIEVPDGDSVRVSCWRRTRVARARRWPRPARRPTAFSGCPGACRRPASLVSPRTRRLSWPRPGAGPSGCWLATARAASEPRTISRSASTS